MSSRVNIARSRILILIALSLGLATLAPQAGGYRPVRSAVLGAAKHGREAGEGLKARLAEVNKQIEGEYTGLEALYKDLHSHPELSLHEFRTSAHLAAELKKLGFTVTTKFGATGVVGVFENGKGPTVLVRTDMDALPVTEATGVSYASKVRTRDKNDNEVGVMHACGHDMHMTCWVGTARLLVALKDHWKGTLVFIGQPAEEIGTGARLMLEAGLFKKFPKPDYGLALHCDAARPFGTVGYTEGLALANVDSVDITVKGKGGHGAAPHTTVDPIVLAARIVLDLQTLVSRETNPTDPAVVTVGSIHGGTKHNIIPSEVKLQLTVRSTKDSVRKHLLEGIKRIAEGCAKAANAPEPIVKVDTSEYTPALYNDPTLAKRIVGVFREALGAENVASRPAVMGGEDFSRYGLRTGVPVFLFWLGTIPPERVAEAMKEGGKPLPSLHSALFAPVPEPTIKTGVRAMSMAVLELMGK
jgi:hippurate hydrolase